ncbi:MAG: hypothetical protein RLZZ526_723, partial [Actinomycetota bacterium]
GVGPHRVTERDNGATDVVGTHLVDH